MPLGGAVPAGPARRGLEVAIAPDSPLTLELVPDAGRTTRVRITSAAGGEGAASAPFDMPAGVEELLVRLLPGTEKALTPRPDALRGGGPPWPRLNFVEAQGTLPDARDGW